MIENLKEVRDELDTLVNKTRENSIAITKIEEAILWIEAGKKRFLEFQTKKPKVASEF